MDIERGLQHYSYRLFVHMYAPMYVVWICGGETVAQPSLPAAVEELKKSNLCHNEIYHVLSRTNLEIL